MPTCESLVLQTYRQLTAQVRSVSGPRKFMLKSPQSGRFRKVSGSPTGSSIIKITVVVKNIRQKSYKIILLSMNNDENL